MSNNNKPTDNEIKQAAKEVSERLASKRKDNPDYKPLPEVSDIDAAKRN